MLRMLDVRLRNITEVRLGNTIRHTVFSHLLYARWGIYPHCMVNVLTRIIRDTDDVVNVLVTAFPLTISALVQFIGAVVLLFVLDPCTGHNSGSCNAADCLVRKGLLP